ncbi:DUF2274 domain-containing protein [Paracidovorax cattleyae]|uniref:DUF2274 domain-containing protein n=1 Tax=Paracidovorax cattleyae TaxID=80868 RepID=UPI00244679F8|nr:DUF2274 domain-containing protein [Paracidovorax cattleyae]
MRGNGSPAARASQNRRKLRLGPLPRTDSTKITFACPASLKADLDRYAALHGQTYGNLSKPGHSLVHRQDLSRPPHHDLSSQRLEVRSVCRGVAPA